MTSMTAAVLGGDLRQCYLAGYMDTHGYTVNCFGTMPLSYLKKNFIGKTDSLKEALANTRLILCPIPFSTDGEHLTSSLENSAFLSLENLLELLSPGQIVIGGNIPADFILACEKKHVSILDLLHDDYLLWANAALTAEGLLASLISNTPFSLNRRKLLLLGYGHCGQEIGKLLRYFNMELFALDQNEDCLSNAAMNEIIPIHSNELSTMNLNYDIIVNTIPSQLFHKSELWKIPKNCILFDIASAPFGFNQDFTNQLSLTLIRCPGIPGKLMPQTAGELIGKSILERMLSHEL